MTQTKKRPWRSALLIAGLAVSIVATNAVGEETLVELTARKGVQQASFDLYTYTQAYRKAETYHLTVSNGDTRGKDRVSSAIITLNGIALLRQKDFNQNVTTIRKEIDERLIQQGKNVLEVEVQGNPSGALGVNIAASYPQPKNIITWYRDWDLDGYGCCVIQKLPEGTPPDPAVPWDWVTTGGDCNDFNPDMYPGHNCLLLP